VGGGRHWRRLCLRLRCRRRRHLSWAGRASLLAARELERGAKLVGQQLDRLELLQVGANYALISFNAFAWLCFRRREEGQRGR